MRGGNFYKGMEGFMALHRRTLEAGYAEQARGRAYDTERQMREAKPSGRLGSGRLARRKDVEDANLLDPQGLFLGALDGQMLFYNATRRCSVTC